MDWHAIKTLELGVTFAEMAKPQMSDEAYYTLLDPDPVWIERAVRRLLHTLNRLGSIRHQVDAGQNFCVPTQELIID